MHLFCICTHVFVFAMSAEDIIKFAAAFCKGVLQGCATDDTCGFRCTDVALPQVDFGLGSDEGVDLLWRMDTLEVGCVARAAPRGRPTTRGGAFATEPEIRTDFPCIDPQQKLYNTHDMHSICVYRHVIHTYVCMYLNGILIGSAS